MCTIYKICLKFAKCLLCHMCLKCPYVLQVLGVSYLLHPSHVSLSAPQLLQCPCEHHM